MRLTFAIAWFLKHSRAGLILRAVGESDEAAHSIGYSVIRVRYLAVLFGGAMAGLAGAYYSLVLTPLWADRLTAGRGWIALALVVFASWRPGRLLAGAYLFGGVMTLELHAKAAGVAFVAPEVLAMLPYLATIFVLAVISLQRGAAGSNAPACLGKPFRATALNDFLKTVEDNMLKLSRRLLLAGAAATAAVPLVGRRALGGGSP